MVIFFCVPLVLAAASLWFRRKTLGLTDGFLLAISIFFGAYTLVDLFFVGLTNENPIVLLMLFTGVWIAWISLWAFAKYGPSWIRQQTSLASLQADAIRCPAFPVIATICVLIAFRAYTSYYFSDYSIADPSELQEIERSLPYWYTSTAIISICLMYAVGLVAWTKVLNSKGLTRLMWVFFALAATYFMFTEGRRAVFSLLIFVFWMLVSNKKTFRAIVLLMIALPILVVASNLYQAYRAVSYRGIPVIEMDARDMVKALTAAEATSRNLSEREALWRFNYLIMNQHFRDDGDLQWGKLLLKPIPNYIPAAILPGKKIFSSEEGIQRAFNLEVKDQGENIFVATYADFGVLGMLIAPLLMAAFVWTCALVMKRLRDPYLRTTLMGFCLFYALNIEAVYSAPVQIARDFLIVSLAYLVARFVLRQSRLTVKLATE